MRIAVATFSGMPPEFTDDQLLLERLRGLGAEAAYEPWDSAGFDWGRYDLVVARSVWDYAARHGEFLAWVDRVGERLENAAELIRWNSDKRYLADLEAAGVPVVATSYVEAGEEPPAIDRQVVIKPTVSAGGRDTGRFGPDSADQGRELIERIIDSGRTAMVQPFLSTVEEQGETAVVTFAGEVSHTLRKRPVLAADEVAPVRADSLGAAEAMYDPELVRAGSADEADLDLARRMVAMISERYGEPPLCARVDMLKGERGDPVVLELEAIEPNLYFGEAAGAAERFARAIIERAAARLKKATS